MVMVGAGVAQSWLVEACAALFCHTVAQVHVHLVLSTQRYTDKSRTALMTTWHVSASGARHLNNEALVDSPGQLVKKHQLSLQQASSHGQPHVQS